MIRYLQFRCSVIEKFCEQPHDNSNCCKLVIVDDPNGHYRENCWYPHAEISGIKFSESGKIWFHHDDYEPSVIPIPGDWRSYILKDVYPEETAKNYVTLAAVIARQNEEREAKEREEFEFKNGERVKIEK